MEAAAKELGYQIPRRKMRRESNGNKLIVVFCPTLTNPYYVMLLHGIEEVAKEKNYGVFVCNTQRDLKIEENYLRMMKSVRPRGIIYTCNPSRSCKEKVEELAAEIPLVIIRFRIMETVAWDTPEAAATSLDVTFFLPIITAPFCPLTHAEG